MPKVSRAELKEHLKQRLGAVGIDRARLLDQVRVAGISTFPLSVVLGQYKLNEAADAIVAELEERLGAPPEDGIQFVD